MNKIAIIVSILGLALGVLALKFSMEKEKTAYVKLDKVFSEFDMSKEYEAKLEGFKNAGSTALDSLKLFLNVVSKRYEGGYKPSQKEIAEFEMKREEYFQRERSFQERYQAQSQEYTEKTMTQLNEYVTTFGKEKEYAFVWGAEGSGTIMYASEGKDVSEEVIVFINNKYAGK